MKTEKEIYEYLRRELGRFEPEEPEAQTEFDWLLTKIAREWEAHLPLQVRDEQAVQHEFVAEDGTGKCCSCGWMCAGGQRSTCFSEWETHKAMAGSE